MPLLAMVWMFCSGRSARCFYTMLDQRERDAPELAGHPALAGMGALRGCRAGAGVFLPSVGQERHGLAQCRARRSLPASAAQPEASAYPKFNAAMLSADAIIPGLGTWPEGLLVARHARCRWATPASGSCISRPLRAWRSGLLAVAGFSGIVKSN